MYLVTRCVQIWILPTVKINLIGFILAAYFVKNLRAQTSYSNFARALVLAVRFRNEYFRRGRKRDLLVQYLAHLEGVYRSVKLYLNFEFQATGGVDKFDPNSVAAIRLQRRLVLVVVKFD